MSYWNWCCVELHFPLAISYCLFECVCSTMDDFVFLRVCSEVVKSVNSYSTHCQCVSCLGLCLTIPVLVWPTLVSFSTIWGHFLVVGLSVNVHFWNPDKSIWILAGQIDIWPTVHSGLDGLNTLHIWPVLKFTQINKVNQNKSKIH